MPTQEAIAKNYLGEYAKETIKKLALTPNLSFDTMKSCVEGAGYLGEISRDEPEGISIIALTMPYPTQEEALRVAKLFPEWAKTLLETADIA